MPSLSESVSSIRLPARIERLWELAYNLWWTWDHDATRLFSLLDPDSWDDLQHNPIRSLKSLPPDRPGATDEARLFTRPVRPCFRPF